MPARPLRLPAAAALTVSLGLLLAFRPGVGSAQSARSPTERLEQTVSELQRQLATVTQSLIEVRAELDQLKAKEAREHAALSEQMAEQQQQLAGQAQLAAAQGSDSGAPGNAARPNAATPASGPGGIPPDLSLWGYGEIYYLHPTSVGERTQFDLARAVFGIGYRFDADTLFNSEFEVEHAVASASDRGEFEVEQFYVDRRLTDWAGARIGLFLMPLGLLNEHHEPTHFYGVQRNFIETLVIPSTWREGGVSLHGNTAAGINWDAGLTSGFDLNGWQPNPTDPLYRTAYDLGTRGVAPLQATHQELQFARAQNLSQYLALSYTGVPGLLAGAAAFTGKAARPEAPPGLPDERVLLWEGHVKWTPFGTELTGLYAQGQLSGTAAYNRAYPGATNPLPAKFSGYYLQAARTLWQHQGMSLAPFVRWEHYDLGADYAGLAPGARPVPLGLASDGSPWPQPRDRVWTFGANWYLNPHVVLKADYQRYGVNRDLTRFDLGLGLDF